MTKISYADEVESQLWTRSRMNESTVQVSRVVKRASVASGQPCKCGYASKVINP